MLNASSFREVRRYARGIFRENNYDTIDSFIKYLESHVEPLTSEINVQESDQYIYITKNIRKVIDKIRIK